MDLGLLPKLFGKTIFLLGGGPSLLDSLNELDEHRVGKEIRQRWIIAINESLYCALDADMLFFRDTTWYLANREVVDAWTGIVVTTAKSRFYSSNVNIVKMQHCNDFLIGGDVIKYGRSGGHIALSLAISLGATRCVLLGYDCKLVNGRSHFHNERSNAIAITYSDYFLPAWKGWGDAARRAGVEVVNATPGSAITEFPHCPLRELLA